MGKNKNKCKKHKFAMHRAAKEGDLERVRQLIEGGVSVDSLDNCGRTPLHWAVDRGHYEVVQLLISSNCDLNIMDYFWFRDSTYGKIIWPEKDRRMFKREEVQIAASLYGETPLMRAAFGGQEEVAALIIRAGADVNQSGRRKRTALHFAVVGGHPRVVRVLLKKEGLDLNFQDELGRTPLHIACYAGFPEIIKQLLEAGADTTLKSNGGQTAVSEGITGLGQLTLEEIRLFLHHGAFLQDCDYVSISENPFLKENVLKDVGLCTQSIVNKFHRQSLPALNSISYFARKLPNIDKFKLKSRQIDEVENLVKCEIKRNTFCNVVKVHPMALSALCVLSLTICQPGQGQIKWSIRPGHPEISIGFKLVEHVVLSMILYMV